MLNYICVIYNKHRGILEVHAKYSNSSTKAHDIEKELKYYSFKGTVHQTMQALCSLILPQSISFDLNELYRPCYVH